MSGPVVDVDVPAPHTPPSPAPDWTMQVHVGYSGAAGTRYHADLMRHGRWAARIAMAQPSPSRAAAERILAERCRDWIARRAQRDRPGDTALQILRR